MHSNGASPTQSEPGVVAAHEPTATERRHLIALAAVDAQHALAQARHHAESPQITDTTRKMLRDALTATDLVLASLATEAELEALEEAATRG